LLPAVFFAEKLGEEPDLRVEDQRFCYYFIDDDEKQINFNKSQNVVKMLR